MRLIDADALKKAIAESEYIKETIDGIDLIEVLVLKDIIDNAPTVFTQEDIDNVLELSYISGQQHPERPKGKWEYIGQSEVTGLKVVECTNCHKRQYGSMNYCGNCGANMVVDLCSICKHGDNCERSDKGISFANHSSCWKFER